MAKTDKKKMNPILWILFAIIIPLIFAFIITAVILNIAGFSVMDWAREQGSELPVISNFIPSEEDKSAQDQVENMNEILNDKDEEILALNNQIDDLEFNITELEDEILRLEQAQESMEAAEEAEPSESTTDSLSDIAKSYEDMKSRNAAEILQLMDRNEALLILQEISNDVRGEILESMDPETAAELTASLMADN